MAPVSPSGDFGLGSPTEMVPTNQEALQTRSIQTHESDLSGMLLNNVCEGGFTRVPFG